MLRTDRFAALAADALRTVDIFQYVNLHRTDAPALPAADTFTVIQRHMVQGKVIEQGIKRAKGT